MKIIKKILLISFACFLFFNIFNLPASAAIEFTPQVAIGGFTGPISTDSIGKYITEVYKYLIGIVGILATVVMMIGGVIWIGAGGNASRISEAKAWISGALMGLVLTLSSYMILNTINPDLVTMKKLDIKPIKPLGCCEITINGEKKAIYTANSDCASGWSDKLKVNYSGTECVGMDVITMPDEIYKTDIGSAP